MRVAVIDDEKEVRDNLTEFITRFSEESGVKLEVSTFPSGDALINVVNLRYTNNFTRFEW